MKLIFLSTLFLIGLHSTANACEQIIGSWQCNNIDNGMSLVTYSHFGDGVLIIQQYGGGKTITLLFDGAEHQYEGEDMKYTGSVSCDANGTGTMSQVSTMSDSADQISVRNSISINGRNMTIDSATDPVGGIPATTSHTTCLKM